ncbi:hypothetical protein ACHAQH_002820 [Verticillium albo-atrum]
MPSSVVGLLSLTNLGPLTTTFTAPEACATNFPGFSGAALSFRPDWAQAGVSKCGEELKSVGECLPYGDQLDGFRAEATSTTEPTSTTEARFLVPYYSPGYHCPSGWETAGVAAMDNGTASITGAFAPKFTDTDDNGEPVTFPPYNFFANVITSALDAQETAVLCCPSGYTMNLREPSCHTNFPVSELAGSTGCVISSVPKNTAVSSFDDGLEFSSSTYVWDYEGTTTTQVFDIPYVVDEQDWETFTSQYTFDESGKPTDEPFPDSDYVGIKIKAAILLVNDGPVETNSAEPSNNSVAPSGSAAPSSATNTVEESGGSALRSTGTWGAIGGMMAVWTVGALAGVGLVAAL